MTAAPDALLDVESLRHRRRPAILVPPHPSPLVVLGSRQPVDDVDAGAVSEAGAVLRRRRGGGGAVLLHPEDAWVEVWLPWASTTESDVRASARHVGAAWRGALAEHGIDAVLHDDGMLRRDEGAVACFAGLGPGELTTSGAKILGLSQWRVREGTLVSTVLAVQPPDDLTAMLSEPGRVPALREATSLTALGRSLRIDDVVSVLSGLLEEP